MTVIITYQRTFNTFNGALHYDNDTITIDTQYNYIKPVLLPNEPGYMAVYKEPQNPDTLNVLGFEFILAFQFRVQFSIYISGINRQKQSHYKSIPRTLFQFRKCVTIILMSLNLIQLNLVKLG